MRTTLFLLALAACGAPDGGADDAAQDATHDRQAAPSCAGPAAGAPEDAYLVGDWDGDGRDTLAVRRGHCVLMDADGDGAHDIEQCFGNGNAEDGYLVGDWDGDGRDNLAVRRGNCALMDTDFDGGHDIEQCFGNGGAEDGYLVGDWDGDGRDNLAVRRDHCVLMDTNFDGEHDQEQCYGNGDTEDGYLVGDWDGDGRDDLAVRRGACVVMPGVTQCYGNGNAEDGYLAGDWDGNGGDDLAVLRDRCALIDTNGDAADDESQCLGNGSSGLPAAKGCNGPVASLEGKRFTVFYQVSKEALAIYADPERGLPRSPDHVHVFSHSGASQPVSAGMAALIHGARDDFKYAPAFDLNKHPGWLGAPESKLAGWARTFRDQAIAAGADFFAFNEAPEMTPTSDQARVQMARMLRYLAEPDDDGVSLRGIFFMTHKPSMPANWTSPAEAFWTAVDDTSDAVVAEHYHGQGWVCGQSLDALGAHFFALRNWLLDAGTPAKRSIANKKFTVLHSSRYSPGPSGWQGADSAQVSLARFQRNLSRAALATRRTPGGFNRISFAPIYDAVTVPGVHERIRLLARWHYAGAGEEELACVAGAPGNCECY